jgi:hypothetical protein
MFRTSKKRGQARFSFIEMLKVDKVSKLKLTPNQISLIETANVLTLAERIELFLVALGNKLTTELYMNVNYVLDHKKNTEVPNQTNLESIEELLNQLPFFYYQDHLPKKNPQNGQNQDFTWYQVSVNRAVSEFMKQYPDDLTEFEEGVLYGYPLSAIRAYSGLITPKHNKPTAASYYLAGVCSADFWDDEQVYYQLWWDRLKELSPKLISQAEAKFNAENIG